MSDFEMTHLRRKGSPKGGRAAHANVRREAMARELIAPVVPSIGNHDACDPEHPASLCSECADLLVVPATAQDWLDWREGRLG